MSIRLSEDQLRARFENRVIRFYIEPQRSAAPTLGSPRFVSVGGQPGAGKGGVLAAVQRSLPGSVIVNGDELRRFHPDYEQLMSDSPLQMPEATADAAGRWVGMSTEYLRAQRASAIVETTLRDAGMLRSEFEAFAAAGFDTELRVVAVPLEISRVATLTRYLNQVDDFGAGRWTPAAAHDQAAMNARHTVRDLVAAGVVDQVVIQDRAGRVFHDASVRGGGAVQGEAAARAVDEARDVRILTPDQARDWLHYTAEALQRRARLNETDPDVLGVAARLATTDAASVARQAYPDDHRAQAEALAVIAQASALDKPAVTPGGAQRPCSPVRGSFPTSAAQAVQNGSQSSAEHPQARSPRMPGARSDLHRGEGR